MKGRFPLGTDLQRGPEEVAIISEVDLKARKVVWGSVRGPVLERPPGALLGALIRAGASERNLPSFRKLRCKARLVS